MYLYIIYGILIAETSPGDYCFRFDFSHTTWKSFGEKLEILETNLPVMGNICTKKNICPSVPGHIRKFTESLIVSWCWRQSYLQGRVRHIAPPSNILIGRCICRLSMTDT